MPMQPLRTRVRHGRIVLDAPTDLPDGTELELVLADGGDGLDAEERERLHESLRESIEQMKRGETIDAAEALAQLRAHQ
jgi:hypothetical protein